MTYMDSGPWYETQVFTKDECYTKMKHTEFASFYTDEAIKVLSLDIHSQFDKIIQSSIDNEYNKCGGLGSIRGYYTFVHRPLREKILQSLHDLCTIYEYAFNILKKNSIIFLHWWYKPGGPGFKKLAESTYVGRLPPPPC